MPYDTLPPAATHRVELDGRERLIVSGVDDVDRFDENEIVMTTTPSAPDEHCDGLFHSHKSKVDISLATG